MNKKRFVLISLAVSLICAHVTDVNAYPEKPVRIVIAQAAGSSTDYIARAIGERLSQRLGQLVIVDPRPGAAGVIGTQYVARAAPDGYTLMVSFSNPNNVLIRNLPFDVLKDFSSVSLVANSPFVLVINPSLPVKNLPELINLAKRYPGKLDYSTTGVGSSQHFSGELLQMLAGIRLTNIPYQGGTPAITAAISGEVSLMFPTAGLALPHIRANKLRPLAVTTSSRSKFLPQVPTIAEHGMPDYHMTSWFGLVVPAGTPQPIITRLNSELGEVLSSKALIDNFESRGIETLFGPPEQLTDFVKRDLEKFRKIANGANITQRNQ